MNCIVLGFTGRIGSGKTTLSKAVAKSLDWPYVSFGDYIKMIAKNQGIKIIRKELQKTGESFVNKNPKKFCEDVLNQVEWVPGKPLVIDGIRHKEIVQILKEKVLPSILHLIYIELAEDKLKKRVINNKLLNYQQLIEFESHSTEIQVRQSLIDIADLCVNSDKPLDILVDEIINWIQNIS